MPSSASTSRANRAEVPPGASAMYTDRTSLVFVFPHRRPMEQTARRAEDFVQHDRSPVRPMLSRGIRRGFLRVVNPRTTISLVAGGHSACPATATPGGYVNRIQKNPWDTTDALSSDSPVSIHSAITHDIAWRTSRLPVSREKSGRSNVLIEQRLGIHRWEAVPLKTMRSAS